MLKKAVLITGASQGLGRELALTFLLNGYNVLVNYNRAEDAAEEIVKQAVGNAIAFRADVGSYEDVSTMITQISSAFGRLDIVINNAGTNIDDLLIRLPEDEWDRIIRTNLTGCFNVIKAAVPLMAKSGGGHIINISSYSGAKGSVGQTAYSASKAALSGLTVSAAKELAEHNIRVNNVIPGYMPTKMGMSSLKAMEKARADSILHTLSDPKEVAGFVAAIAALKNVTGQTFSLESRIF